MNTLPRVAFNVINALCVLVVGSLSSSSSSALPLLFNSKSQLVELTYPFNNRTKKLNFKLTPVQKGTMPNPWGGEDFFVHVNAYAAAEHGGTHVDAPSHFVEGGATIGELDLKQLMGPAVVIDIRPQVRRDSDYLLSVADIEQWESEHGPVPAGAIVIAHTGYGKYWGNPQKYFGLRTSRASTSADVSVEHGAIDVHWPAIAVEAAQALVQRQIKAFGSDALSPDNSRTFPKIHKKFLSENVIIIENVANVDRLPAHGANIYGFPMLIEEGTGAPVRLFAQVPLSQANTTGGGSRAQNSTGGARNEPSRVRNAKNRNRPSEN